MLHVVSERRAITLKGYAFREFCERIVPLLDGQRSLEQIQQETADVFDGPDVADMLTLLASHGILVDAPDDGLASAEAERMMPQRNLFVDLAAGEPLQRRLASATVSVIGLGGAGPAAVLALAAVGVGEVRCHDPLPVATADVYFSPFLGLDAVGAGRAERVATLARGAAPQVNIVASAEPLEEEDDLRRAVDGADFVVCCLDAGQTNLVFKLNRVCLADGHPWIACGLAGAEVVVGPAVDPGRSACYMCYRMRAVACAGNAQHAFSYERQLDRRRRDDSAQRENLVFSAGIAGNLVASEVVKTLSGLAAPSLIGRILTLRLTDLSIERHAVLRKPDCPACFAPAGNLDAH
jgi:adenylyltransferase/sulfurtransferase